MMKNNVAMTVGLFLINMLFHNCLEAQTGRNWKIKTLAPYHVSIAVSKTTNIVFPYSIVSVDLGSRDILAQKADGVDNILQLKAAREDFSQSNVSIVTADGKLTSFLVDYATQPSVLNLLMSPDSSRSSLAFSSKDLNQEELRHYAGVAAASKEKNVKVKDQVAGICLDLNGIFVCGSVIFLRFNLQNDTNIGYDIDQLRLYVRDLRKSKRTATQETEILPILVHKDIQQLKPNSKQTIVMAVQKFTIPDQKYLSVELLEKGGGRNLDLKVKNRKIVKAISIR